MRVCLVTDAGLQLNWSLSFPTVASLMIHMDLYASRLSMEVFHLHICQIHTLMVRKGVTAPLFKTHSFTQYAPPFFWYFWYIFVAIPPLLRHFMRSPTSSFDIQCLSYNTLTSPTPSYWRYLFQQPTTTIECLVRRVEILGTLYWYKYKLRQEVNLQDSLA